MTDTTETKPWYTSRGVLGGLAGVIIGVASAFGLDSLAGLEAQLTDTLIAIGTAIAGGLAILGRIKADKKIK